MKLEKVTWLLDIIGILKQVFDCKNDFAIQISMCTDI